MIKKVVGVGVIAVLTAAGAFAAPRGVAMELISSTT
jgi:hypothetical protein